MKSFLVALLVLGSISAFASPKCNESRVQSIVRNRIQQLLGSPANGTQIVVQIQDVTVLTTGDELGDDIKALYTYKQTIGDAGISESEFTFDVIGYANFNKKTCKAVDATALAK